jgi:hypothetical protein
MKIFSNRGNRVRLKQCCGSEIIFSDPDPVLVSIADMDPALAVSSDMDSALALISDPDSDSILIRLAFKKDIGLHYNLKLELKFT